MVQTKLDFIKNFCNRLKKIILEKLLIKVCSVALFLLFFEKAFATSIKCSKPNDAINYSIMMAIVLWWVISFICIKRIKKIFIKNALILITIIIAIAIGFVFRTEKSVIEFWGSIECFQNKGEYITDNVCGNKYCRVVNIDDKKKCTDDMQCEGVCVIENSSEIKKVQESNFQDYLECIEFPNTTQCHYRDINLSDWKSRNGVEIKGRCGNEGKKMLMSCNSDDYSEIEVNNGVIRTRGCHF